MRFAMGCRKFRLLVCVSLAVGLCIPVLAQAGGIGVAAQSEALKDIRASDNAVWADLGASRINWAGMGTNLNLATGGPITQDPMGDSGWLPRIGLGASMLTNGNARSPYLRNIYGQAEFHYSRGASAPSGDLCNNSYNCEPALDSTKNVYMDLDLQMGRGFSLGNRAMLIPYIDMQYQYWKRDLMGNAGYTDTYINVMPGIGLKAQYSPASRWVGTIWGGANAPLIKSNLITNGFAYDNNAFTPSSTGSTFNLGQQISWKVGGKVGYRFTSHLEITGSVAYENYNFGGGSDSLQTVYEPSSNLTQTIVSTGISYHFFGM